MTTDKKVNGLIFVVIILALILGFFVYRVQKIHGFLGNNLGEDKTKWTGLTGNYRENIIDLRRVLDDLNCRVWTLEGKGPCPGGGTVPKDDGGYPP